MAAFRPVPGAHALRAWSDADLQRVADAMAPTWRAWLADWSAAADAAESTVTAARVHDSESASRDWRALGARKPGGAWLAGGGEHAERLVHWLLFGELPTAAVDSGEAIAATLRTRACDELLLQLRSALGIAPAAAQPVPGNQLWHPWSGAVELVFGCEDAELHVLLDSDCVDAVMGRPAQAALTRRAGGLASIPQALGSQRVLLRAVFEPVELDLGLLIHLRPGDILPLPHSLDADVALADGDGRRVLGGFLGCADSRRALQLASGVSNTEQLAS